MSTPLQPLPSEASSPLTACQALPDVTPLELPYVRTTAADKERAEKQRVSAWWSRPRWHDGELQPYSLGRDECWLRMRELEMPACGIWTRRMEVAHALRLLFLCSVSAEQILSLELPELAERADEWTDQHVPRAETAAAVALVRRLQHEASLMRARPRPSDRKGDSGNTALPVTAASYIVLVASAVPRMTMHEIEWDISLARGWSLIHAHWIASGTPTLWLDKAASKTGRWMRAFRERRGI